MSGKDLIVIHNFGEPDEETEDTRVGPKGHTKTQEKAAFAKNLAKVGMRYSEIAELLDISIPTLRRYYAKEIKAGLIEAKAAVGKSLFQEATRGNIAAIKWFDVTRGNMRPDATFEQDDELESGSVTINLMDGNTPDKDRNEI